MTKKLKCLVVDDDEICRLEVSQLIQRNPMLELSSVCTDAYQALDYLMKNDEVDLIFLDVMMPGMTGIEFLNCLRSRKQAVIIMTTDKEQAINAFDYEASDFLHKPITPARFNKAVVRVYAIHHQEKKSDNKPEIADTSNVSEDEKFVFIRKPYSIERIPFETIVLVKTLGNYSEFVTEDSKRHTVHQSLKSFFEKLPAQFVRVHQSYVININFIQEVTDNFVLVRNEEIPLSKQGKIDLMGKIDII